MMRRTQITGVLLLTVLLVLGACTGEHAPTDDLVAELQSRITFLEEQLSEKEATIDALQQEIQEKENRIQELEKNLKEATAPPDFLKANARNRYTFEEIVPLLDTPAEVSTFMRNNIRYQREEINEYAPAETIFIRGYDDCDGHATIQAYFLKVNGYDAWNIGIAIKTPYGHNVCGYKDNNKWFVLDTNGIMRGPFETLEQLADEVGNLVNIPKGSSIYLIDPFDIISTTSFPKKYQVYRE